MEKSVESLVSVITPCYNGRKYLADFLDSLIAQTYSNIEFIFINDGSKDNTQKILFSYKEKFKKNGIKLIKKKYALRRRRAGYKPIPKTGGE